MWDAACGMILSQAGSVAWGLVRRWKTQPANLLQHPLRRELYEHVLGGPGRSFHELASSVQGNRGTVAYHLRLLEAAGLIQSLDLDRERHFYGQNVQERLLPLAYLQRPQHRRILQAILDDPGLIQKSLNHRTGMSRKVARKRLDRLQAADLLVEQRQERTRRYWPTETLRRLWSLFRRPP